jgi:hypothetical protein
MTAALLLYPIGMRLPPKLFAGAWARMSAPSVEAAADPEPERAEQATDSTTELPQKPTEAAPPPPATSGNDLKPGEPPQLLMKRSQREGAFGKTIFMLDARMALNADDRELLRKHKLHKEIVYESAARQKHREKAAGHAASVGQNKPGWTASGSEQARVSAARSSGLAVPG